MIIDNLMNARIFSAYFKQWEGRFNALDNTHKWAVVLAIIACLFAGWQISVQKLLSWKLGSSRVKVLDLKVDEATTTQQIERFKKLQAENKLIPIGEYRNQMSGRTAVSAGLGQWGEEAGLFLSASKQQGNELTLEFTGSYPAAMNFFEQLTNKADGLMVFKAFKYEVVDDQASGGLANILLQVVFGR